MQIKSLAGTSQNLQGVPHQTKGKGHEMQQFQVCLLCKQYEYSMNSTRMEHKIPIKTIGIEKRVTQPVS